MQRRTTSSGVTLRQILKSRQADAPPWTRSLSRGPSQVHPPPTVRSRRSRVQLDHSGPSSFARVPHRPLRFGVPQHHPAPTTSDDQGWDDRVPLSICTHPRRARPSGMVLRAGAGPAERCASIAKAERRRGHRTEGFGSAHLIARLSQAALGPAPGLENLCGGVDERRRISGPIHRFEDCRDSPFALPPLPEAASASVSGRSGENEPGGNPAVRAVSPPAGRAPQRQVVSSDALPPASHSRDLVVLATPDGALRSLGRRRSRAVRRSVPRALASRIAGPPRLVRAFRGVPAPLDRRSPREGRGPGHRHRRARRASRSHPR